MVVRVFLVRNRNPVMTVRTKKEVGLINSCWILIKLFYRTMTSSPMMGYRKTRFQTDGKERRDCMR